MTSQLTVNRRPSALLRHSTIGHTDRATQRRLHHAGSETQRDAAEFITFAVTWAPYELPAAEVFVRFGMSTQRFTERLWDLVHHFGSDDRTLTILHHAYSPAEQRAM